MDKELNQRITKLRKEMGYTQEEFGKLLGMKTSAYSQLERNGKIDTVLLKKMAKVLNVDVYELLTGQPINQTPNDYKEILNQIENLIKESKAEDDGPEIVIGYKYKEFSMGVEEVRLLKQIRRLNQKNIQEVIDIITNKLQSQKV